MGRWVWGKGCVVQDQPACSQPACRAMHTGCCQVLRTLHSSLLAKDRTSSSVRPSLSAWVQKSAHERYMQRREGRKVNQSSWGAEVCACAAYAHKAVWFEKPDCAWGACKGEGKAMGS